MRNKCKVEDCELHVAGKGYCNTHYQRWRRHGDPHIVKANHGNRSIRPVPSIRKCKTCGKTGPPEEFKNKTNFCKPCALQWHREWRAANPERVMAMRERQRTSPTRVRTELRRRAKNLGLDPDLVLAYYDAHDGRCEICGNPPRDGGRDLNMDHDHETGEFRGMLCDNCNAGLGRFKDSVVNLEMAIAYLKRHGRE